MKPLGKRDTHAFKKATSMFALAIGAGFGFSLAPQEALAVVTPDNVPPDSMVDTENDRPYIVGLGIRSEAGNSGGSCSGLLINPRTVLFAAHCVDTLPPSAYDGDAPGNRAQVGYTTDPTFGRTNLREYLFGSDFVVPAGDARTIDARSVSVWWDPRARFGPLADPNGGTFLPADIAIAAFDRPNELLGRDAQDGIGLLFSPVDRLVPVAIAGYGQAGNGLTGTRLAGTENTFFRRVARNMLGYLGSERDISLGVYGQAQTDFFWSPAEFNYQDLYWLDFDDPQNRPFSAEVGRNTLTTTVDFNVLADEAVEGEAITAAGDSGSPLITDAYGREVSLGVLSQGSRFFHDSVGNPDDNFVTFTEFSNFGTVAGYNPLFLFWDQIVINNPYKYVQARGGTRDWTDPSTWVQEVDPLYFTLQNGRLRNGVPTTPALGSTDAAANLGTVNQNPAPVADCALTNEGCLPTGGSFAPQPGVEAAPGVETMPGVEAVSGNHNQGNHGVPNYANPTGTADWLTGGLISIGSGPLTGPGTTGFVPNNTNGTAGVQNTARFFEVNLRNRGTLNLRDADITIDRLNIRGFGAELRIREGASLTTTISSYLDYGTLRVDGAFNPRAFDIFLGIVEGKGSITAPGGVANTAGVISPGGDDVGTLTINGDYAQSGFGTVLFQIGRTSSDLLRVNGDVNMAGNLLVVSQRRLRFGDRFEVVTGESITGNFDRTIGSGTLLFGRTVADANSIDLVIDAQRLASYFSSDSRYGSLALALDKARLNPSAFNSLSSVFDTLDYRPVETLQFALPTLAPINAFQTTPMAIQYADSFARGLDARTSELRSGVRGLSQRSALAGMRMAQAGSDTSRSSLSSDARAVDTGDRLGFFVAGHGNLSALGTETFDGDRYNPQALTSQSQAEATVGVDYRVNEHFALGVATTLSRYLSRDPNDGVSPLRHNGYGVMLYGTAWKGGLHADSFFGVARHDYEVSRTPGQYSSLTAEANSGATQTLAGASAGWTFDSGDGLKFGPTVGLKFSRINFDAYRESGGASYALDVHGRSIESLTAETALGFSYQPVKNGRAAPFAAYGRAGLVNELGDGADVVTASFAAAPDIAFTIDQALEKQWVSASAGLSYQFSPNTTAHFEAVSDMGRGPLNSTSIQVGFNWAF